MDFIKGNEQVRIDPSGIDISGAGHIFMIIVLLVTLVLTTKLLLQMFSMLMVN